MESIRLPARYRCLVQCEIRRMPSFWRGRRRLRWSWCATVASSPSAETLEDEENDEILLLDNGTVDLDEVFTTALVLAMDSKHVCSEDCKGLCATCGADLNEGPCGCKPEIDPRFAALAQLLDKESE